MTGRWRHEYTMRQVIQVSLEDKPGALMRVVGIVSALGANIESLTVEPDPRRPGISRMTLAAELNPEQLRRALGKINNLIHVVDAGEVDHQENVERTAGHGCF
ncbi:MAG: ACT domain-containing protein [Bryobacterales bacterium]|nr:ACT domain-containing protein [Bryobacterales bacterium]